MNRVNLVLVFGLALVAALGCTHSREDVRAAVDGVPVPRVVSCPAELRRSLVSHGGGSYMVALCGDEVFSVEEYEGSKPGRTFYVVESRKVAKAFNGELARAAVLVLGDPDQEFAWVEYFADAYDGKFGAGQDESVSICFTGTAGDQAYESVLAYLGADNPDVEELRVLALLAPEELEA